MLLSEGGLIRVSVDTRHIKWYERKGYEVPKTKVQLWANINGKRVKNGIEYRVVRGTEILVKPEDLPPESNQYVSYRCETCGEVFKTQWKVYRKKMSKNCKACAAKKGFKGGCHSYWVEKLINNNPDAACDISGERDKRFLVLHHLLSRSLGGEDTEDNYVVLSANYHMAFHVSNGGTTAPCRPEHYHAFKEKERSLLAEDWVEAD